MFLLLLLCIERFDVLKSGCFGFAGVAGVILVFTSQDSKQNPSCDGDSGI